MAGNGAVLRSPLCMGFKVTSSHFYGGLWIGGHGHALVLAGALRHVRPSLPPRIKALMVQCFPQYDELHLLPTVGVLRAFVRSGSARDRDGLPALVTALMALL